MHEGRRGRERESGETRGRAKGRNEPPGTEIAVSVLVFISASVVGDATLKACQLRIALDETKPRKWRRRERESEREEERE